MVFFENNCLNGQFGYAIEAGEPAVKLPIPACAEVAEDSGCWVEMLGISAAWRKKQPIALGKIYRWMVAPTHYVMIGERQNEECQLWPA